MRTANCRPNVPQTFSNDDEITTSFKDAGQSIFNSVPKPRQRFAISEFEGILYLKHLFKFISVKRFREPLASLLNDFGNFFNARSKPRLSVFSILASVSAFSSTFLFVYSHPFICVFRHTFSMLQCFSNAAILTSLIASITKTSIQKFPL
jgi:hypothetical protein